MNEREAIQTVWQYMQLGQAPRDADALIVLGCRDDRVAAYGAQLAERYQYETIVITGGASTHNSRLSDWHEPTEAEHFAHIFHEQSKQPREVLIEPEAQNTGQNATRSFELLQKHLTVMPRTTQLVTKPYMERRAVATFEAQWPGRPETQFFTSSWPSDFSQYCDRRFTKEETVRIMLKDFMALDTYADRGWQTPQTIPKAVREAADFLKRSKIS